MQAFKIWQQMMMFLAVCICVVCVAADIGDLNCVQTKERGRPMELCIERVPIAVPQEIPVAVPVDQPYQVCSQDCCPPSSLPPGHRKNIP